MGDSNRNLDLPRQQQRTLTPVILPIRHRTPTHLHGHSRSSQLAYLLRGLHECGQRLYALDLPSLTQYRIKLGLKPPPC